MVFALLRCGIVSLDTGYQGVECYSRGIVVCVIRLGTRVPVVADILPVRGLWIEVGIAIPNGLLQFPDALT
ncbi:hypothetical protein FEAC_26250 [Ferrimicrobium acidiphilum DSM 19497]|uniref:Uncharacterized protein n=1 Tax=Ferrimicrobium acidiphilum DSM 19497 TaxID=1121877 RepID=A0A0D8FQW3_9ACTN|nr:hypothetical protein FEAC_26250 [Ferrimicrobium acidiphilum DSM 19497]